MSRQWRAWKAHGAPRLLCQWLRNGVPLKWKGAPPTIRPGQGSARVSDEARAEMSQLLIDGAFIPPEPNEKAFVSPIFTIPKRDGGVRLIHDLREVNSHLQAPHFSLHGCKDAGNVVRNSEWLCALDLRRGYQQIFMSREARRFLGAEVDGRIVVSSVLPFGLSLSPYIFTRYTNWLAGLIRQKTGLEVAVYIDDFLVGGRTKEEVEDGLNVIRSLFKELGVTLSTKKPATVAREVEFLGFLWSAERKTVGLTGERRKQYRRVVQNLLRGDHPVPRWRTAIGKLVFLKEAVGPTLRHVRSLLKLIRGKKVGTRVSAEGEAREDLVWWREALKRTSELSLLRREVSASIASDASEATAAYSLELDGLKIQRTFNVIDQSRHINSKELEALLRCLQEHGDLLKGRRVVWYCDNVTARAVVMRQGSQQGSQMLWEVTKMVLDIMESKNITIIARHVPGKLNRAADALSRPGQMEEQWSEALKIITDKWGPLQRDPCGMTGAPEEVIENLSWSGSRTILKPVIRRIPEILDLLKLVVDRSQRTTPPSFWKAGTVLITPTWRKALWWNSLAALRSDWINLGRLEDRGLAAWKSRNKHAPSWSASLIPTRMLSGPRELGPATEEQQNALQLGS